MVSALIDAKLAPVFASEVFLWHFCKRLQGGLKVTRQKGKEQMILPFPVDLQVLPGKPFLPEPGFGEQIG